MWTGLVHDYLLVMRGAERTFAAIADCWPSATSTPCSMTRTARTTSSPATTSRRPTFSTWVCASATSAARCRCSPRAIESLPVQDHDLVVSSSSAFAHGFGCPRARACLLLPLAVSLRLARARAGLDRGAAGRPARAHALARPRPRLGPARCRGSHALRRHLSGDPLADPRLLWPRLRAHSSAGRCRALRARRAGGLRAGRDRDRPPQARRHRAGGGAARGAARQGRGYRPRSAALASTIRGQRRVPRARAETDSSPAPRDAAHVHDGNVEEFGIAAVEAQAAGRPVVAAAAGGRSRPSSPARPACSYARTISMPSPRPFATPTSTASRRKPPR